MADIENEFKKLLEEVIERISNKESSGEYDSYDASRLTQMVNNIIEHGDSSNYGGHCPEGHQYPDCGWSPSMGYHC